MEKMSSNINIIKNRLILSENSICYQDFIYEQSKAIISQRCFSFFDDFLHFWVIEILLHKPKLIILLILYKRDLLQNMSSEGSMEVDNFIIGTSENHSLKPIFLHSVIKHCNLLDLIKILQFRDSILCSPTCVHVFPLFEGIKINSLDQFLTFPLQLSKELNLRLFRMLLAQLLILLQFHMQGCSNNLLIVHIYLIQSNIGIISLQPNPCLRFDMFFHLFSEKLDQNFFIQVSRSPNLIHLQECIGEQKGNLFGILWFQFMKAILKVVIDLHCLVDYIQTSSRRYHRRRINFIDISSKIWILLLQSLESAVKYSNKLNFDC